jgi:hypothetical protein
MTLPMTTYDVCVGRSLVEYDSNWKPYRQPDWFDKLCRKLKIVFGKKMKKNCKDNTDNV